MSRKFGGKTELGNHLNETGSKQEGLRIARARNTIGTIIAFGTNIEKDGHQVLARATNPKSDGLYKFIVRLDDGQETGFLPLMGKAANHAAINGHPADFVGQKCYIVYEGPSTNRGRILDVVDEYIDPLTVGSHNQVQITGAAFAPPGSGLI
jgi:hypothetical protein